MAFGEKWSKEICKEVLAVLVIACRELKTDEAERTHTGAMTVQMWEGGGHWHRFDSGRQGGMPGRGQRESIPR